MKTVRPFENAISGQVTDLTEIECEKVIEILKASVQSQATYQQRPFPCRICGEPLADEPFERYVMADNKTVLYIWPAGAEHYVEVHNFYPAALRSLIEATSLDPRTKTTFPQ